MKKFLKPMPLIGIAILLMGLGLLGVSVPYATMIGGIAGTAGGAMILLKKK